MSRRKQATKRKIAPDPLCNNVLMARLINYTMRDGKKGVAMRNVYEALYGAVAMAAGDEKAAAKIVKGDEAIDFSQIDESTIEKMVRVMGEAIENIKPAVEVKSRRVGGANYQVPVEVRDVRRVTLALRWLVQMANKRNEKTFVERLCAEIHQATKGLGGAMKKKEEMLRMAKANRVFSHYRV